MTRATTASLHAVDPAPAGASDPLGTTAAFVAGRRQKSLEVSLLVLGIAVSAAIIWGTVRLAFPRGEGRDEPGAPPAASVGVPPDVPAAPAPPPPPAFEGAITRISRTVQMRASSELAWGSARVGRLVHTHDAIQTLEGASALIKVRDQGDIRIGENSLVVFEANGTDDFLATGAAVASVTRGAFRGRLKADDDREVLGIRLANATVRVQGTRPGQPADFDLQVNADQSASIVILRGRGQVRARSGVRTLASGQGVQVSADGRHLEVQSMPPVPALVEPAADQVIVYRKERPPVMFRWQTAAPVDDYRFLLATDRDFREPLVDQRLTGASYAHAGLGTGDYYWKVSSRRGWLEGAPTGVATVHVERAIDADVREALTDLYQHAASARDLVDRAEGVLVFPRVIKGGIIIGGEYGEGALLSRGRTLDYYTLKSASLGLQMGGQTRKVALLFMTQDAYQGFLKSTGWKVGVDGSVALAALRAGKAIDSATSDKPIIAFVFSNKGLMYNLTLEGSKISRLPD